MRSHCRNLEELPNATITSEHFDKDKLKEKMKDVDVLIVRSATKVTKEIIDSSPKLKIIGRAGMGLDNIDLEAAKVKNIKVLNTPSKCSFCC